MTTIEATTGSKPKNSCFKKGQLVAAFEAEGRKVSRNLIQIDELMPQLTCAR